MQHGAYDMPQVMLVAYLFEFVGVFLLAVEAIKLENLRGMRARIQWIYRIFNPPVVRGPEADDPDLKKVVIAIWLLGLATQLLFLLLLFVIGGINALDEYPKLYIPEARTRPGMDIMTGIFFLAVPLAIGVLLVMPLAFVLGAIINALVFIERQTTNGIVGIVGFCSYCIYMGLKIYASHS